MWGGGSGGGGGGRAIWVEREKDVAARDAEIGPHWALGMVPGWAEDGGGDRTADNAGLDLQRDVLTGQTCPLTSQWPPCRKAESCRHDLSLRLPCRNVISSIFALWAEMSGHENMSCRAEKSCHDATSCHVDRQLVQAGWIMKTSHIILTFPDKHTCTASRLCCHADKKTHHAVLSCRADISCHVDMPIMQSCLLMQTIPVLAIRFFI
jgi:hypothetical protein